MSDEKNYNFEPFCGLHYTSESDIEKYSTSFDSFVNKSFILTTYINYFTNIVLGMFKVHNLPDNIDEQFVIRNLVRYGSVALFKTVTKGLEIQPFATKGLYNIYGIPTKISIKSAPNCSTEYNGLQIDNSNDFEIIKLNPQATSLYSVIYYFCDKITEVQRAIDVNVNTNQTPLIFEAEPEQKTTIEKVINKLSQQVKTIILNKKAGWRPDEGLKTVEVGAQWKASQMVEVLQYYKSEFFTFLGINHIPYEKKANMIKDEVMSNSHILRLTIDSMLDSLNECAKKANKKFGTKIYFSYSVENVYSEEFSSEADSKLVADIISKNEAEKEKLKEAEFRNKIEGES